MKCHLTRIAWLLVAAAALIPSSASAANRVPVRSNTAPYREVPLFEAMKNGEIEVQLIPKDATQATLIVKNKGKEPVSVRLPEAFAGVPVHAQFGGGMGGMGGGMGGMGGGMGGMGGGMGGGQGMGMGGGMGGMGGGMGGMGGGMGGMGGGGGGFFNVVPEKPGKIKLDAVCLEHGKPDPTPRMKYTIAPIETVTSDPAAIEVVKMLGQGMLPQNTAQAAVWNRTDNLSWAELAQKDRVRLLRGQYVEKFFNHQELAMAMQAVQVATARAQFMKSQATTSPTAITSPGLLEAANQ
ncbi:MAG: hypothetical protein KDB14_13355 [Planctomycetales bacterium]|nr:hypothetical protein [Planctomycetales bacterium]